ncbi:30S ribosomal protein S9 [Catenuloplanes atrovinosus]|uniref:Small ribosomal subunit protein uS9 n=1 Tax=Catenuloplanes atrovinosus TaxID=137266 RepID=A0AAE4CCM9_9ACTN|nr:small subunit ribosomal protein S9 [Catenuloplanes atrovinosus]
MTDIDEQTPAADAPATDTDTDTTVAVAEATESGSESESEVAPATATATLTRVPRGERPIQTVGRRKEAIVRVRLVPGTGKVTCNGRDIEAYFPSKVHQQLIREPLVTSEKVETFDVIANLRGGGITGQAGALRLAIARALVSNDGDDRPALKKAGFLTRDARVKESKKYGLKKARKAPQYSKR